MINSVALVGRAGKDPDSKSFSSGAKCVNLTMAVNRPTKEKETDWFDIQLWGLQAEIAEKYIKKGHLFGIQGNLKQETWEKDNQKHSKIVVVGHVLRLMQPKSEGGAEGPPADEQPAQADIFGSQSHSSTPF